MIALKRARCSPSPFQLTQIRDLPFSGNVETVSLHDILGNPLIKEAWVFNYCFDIDWMMQFFDPDVRDLVHVKIIHGSWRNEDSNRKAIDHACSHWSNVEAFRAYLPDQFGTHHSKMFVVFTHDEQAEVVIHTANMLSKDWANMTQAVWRSGPLLKTDKKEEGPTGVIGSGKRFKHDLLAYLKEYKKSTRALRNQLQKYDFSAVRGALVASVPSKCNNILTTSTEAQHLWGYPQLREVLSHIKRDRSSHGLDSHRAQSHLVAQVSSIASLPNRWVQNLVASTSPLPSLHHSTASSKQGSLPSLSIIFPTAPNVASSLDGYAAGGSIHMKAQSATHMTQINSLRPHLCQWTKGSMENFQAGRHKAAPHIKTYTQFKQKPTEEALQKGEVEVEWALLTSANLSVQAWGSLPRAEGKGKSAKKAGGGEGVLGGLEEGVVQIQSFEIGVLVWPELFLDEFEDDSMITKDSTSRTKREVKARMIPVFGKNAPSSGDEDDTLTIGLRLPYDLPLTPYKAGEMPWSPQGKYLIPDSRGGVWSGY